MVLPSGTNSMLTISLESNLITFQTCCVHVNNFSWIKSHYFSDMLCIYKDTLETKLLFRPNEPLTSENCTLEYAIIYHYLWWHIFHKWQRNWPHFSSLVLPVTDTDFPGIYLSIKGERIHFWCGDTQRAQINSFLSNWHQNGVQTTRKK
jgi:hypothetical protein